ncbi:unannotated protein [freshwater metagenome]|uniref:Unannotated protein n=1 Tax=freshwater metagenome TaxID=449393 RepID=A0A6J6EGV1_9ZZZZ
MTTMVPPATAPRIMAITITKPTFITSTLTERDQQPTGKCRIRRVGVNCSTLRYLPLSQFIPVSNIRLGYCQNEK